MNISTSIFSTLSFFELLRRPLTETELYHNLWKCSCSRKEFDTALHKLIEEGVLFRKGNFILPSKEEAFEVYDHYTKHDFDREYFENLSKRLSGILRHLPFVREVYVVNSVAFGGVREGSDLDLFIVLRDEYMWLGRTLVTLVVSLLGIRRFGENIAKRVCLSFFVTESNMNLESIRIQEHDDPYLVYWVLWAKQIVVCDSFTVDRDLIKNNEWISEYVSNAFHGSGNPRIVPTKSFSSFAKILEGILFYSGIAWILERILRYFLKRRALKKHQKSNEKASIAISDTMLKFHENDRREEFWEHWEKGLKKSF